MEAPAERPLSEQKWEPVSFSHPCLAFLRAEWDKIPAPTAAHRSLIDHPDLTSNAENAQRLQLLRTRREPLLRRAPSDTAWFEVSYLRPNHLTELLVIGRCGWDSKTDANELLRVAARCSKPLATDPSAWTQPLLWGHTRQGPFTILEGNNRLVALAAAFPRPAFQLSVYVGLSAAPCLWHLLDLP